MPDVDKANVKSQYFKICNLFSSNLELYAGLQVIKQIHNCIHCPDAFGTLGHPHKRGLGCKRNDSGAHKESDSWKLNIQYLYQCLSTLILVLYY